MVAGRSPVLTFAFSCPHQWEESWFCVGLFAIVRRDGNRKGKHRVLCFFQSYFSKELMLRAKDSKNAANLNLH